MSKERERKDGRENTLRCTKPPVSIELKKDVGENTPCCSMNSQTNIYIRIVYFQCLKKEKDGGENSPCCSIVQKCVRQSKQYLEYLLLLSN